MKSASKLNLLLGYFSILSSRLCSCTYCSLCGATVYSSKLPAMRRQDISLDSDGKHHSSSQKTDTMANILNTVTSNSDEFVTFDASSDLEPKLDTILADVASKLPSIDFDISDVSSEDDIPIFTRKPCDLTLGSLGLHVGEVVHPEQVTFCVKESEKDVELVSRGFETDADASVFVPSAAVTMLRELEKPPDESKSLAELFLKLSDVSAVHSNGSCDPDHKTVEDDIYASEIMHGVKKQKSMHNHLDEAQAKIAKLKESSRKMVSMFIPTDAPKLSISNNAIDRKSTRLNSSH